MAIPAINRRDRMFRLKRNPLKLQITLPYPNSSCALGRLSPPGTLVVYHKLLPNGRLPRRGNEGIAKNTQKKSLR